MFPNQGYSQSASSQSVIITAGSQSGAPHFGSYFSIPALWNLCSESVGVYFEILIEDSDTGVPSSIAFWIEWLLGFQFWYCELCVKNWWGGGRKHCFVIFCFVGCFNCWWLTGSGVGQKVLFRTNWNRIFSLLFRLKSRSAWGASRHPAFMVLVLIKRMTSRGEFKISFCYPKGLRASPQTYCERGDVI